MAEWTQDAPATDKTTPPPSPLRPGDRISVFWTELAEWYTATFTSSRVEQSDVGGLQRASRVVYDAVGPWAASTAKDLTYWHCLDDEQWQHVATEGA